MKSTTFTAVKALLASDALTPAQAEELQPMLGAKPETDELMTRQELAQLFKVTPRSIDRMRDSGQLSPVPTGMKRSIRFRRSQVLALMSATN